MSRKFVMTIIDIKVRSHSTPALNPTTPIAILEFHWPENILKPIISVHFGIF